jgi:hypothetical protein
MHTGCVHGRRGTADVGVNARVATDGTALCSLTTYLN